MVALLCAALLLLARLFKLGFLADFLSRTVLVGFLAGVGLQVGIAMLGDMLGLTISSHLPWQQVAEMVRQGPPRAGAEAALSAAALAVLWAGKRFAPRWPAALALVAGAIAASAAFGFEGRGIAVLGAVAGGLPPLGLPDVGWREVLALLPVAASCVVVIVAQSAATARSFAQRHGEVDDFNRDLLGLAAANAAAGVSGAFVVNGSPTQTATAEAAGARSQVAQLTFAAVTLAVLLFLTPALQFLPRCVLAALVFTIALHMIDLRALRDIRRESPGEYGLALLTAAAAGALEAAKAADEKTVGKAAATARAARVGRMVMVGFSQARWRPRRRAFVVMRDRGEDPGGPRATPSPPPRGTLVCRVPRPVSGLAGGRPEIRTGPGASPSQTRRPSGGVTHRSSAYRCGGSTGFAAFASSARTCFPFNPRACRPGSTLVTSIGRQRCRRPKVPAGLKL